MSKWLFITITAALLGLFGTIVYYGMQALEPHTYTPNEETVAVDVAQKEIEPNASPSAILPALPGLPNPSVNIISEANSKEPTKTLSTEAQLAYLATSTERTVNIEKLFFAPEDAAAFQYSKNSVFVIDNPSYLTPGSLWKLDTEAKTVSRIAGPSLGLTARWSKNGRYILTMETTTQGAISLHFIDTKLNKKTPLRIAIIPSKCFIENDIPVIYCGIPYGAPEGVILPDDYLKGIFSSRDRIVKIDFKAPKITELWNGASEAIDIRNPARIGTELFFMSGEDESVWSIKL